MGQLPFLEVKTKKDKFRLFIQSEFKELEVCRLDSDRANALFQMELFFFASHMMKDVSVIRRKLYLICLG